MASQEDLIAPVFLSVSLSEALHARLTLVVSFLFGAVACMYAFGSLIKDPCPEHLPLVNRKGGKRKFIFSAREILDNARKQYPGQPYRVRADIGEAIILPPELGEELRNHPHCSFSKAADTDFECELFGWDNRNFEIEVDQLLQSVGRKQMTRYIGVLLPELRREAALAIPEHFGESTEWKEFEIHSTLIKVVARLGSRAFLGEPLCHNKDWLRITEDFTTRFFWCSAIQRMFPKFVRPVTQWLLPPCRKVRGLAFEAHRLINGVLEQRRAIKEAALKAGEPAPVFNDMLAWMEEEAAGKPYNEAAFQLGASMASTHTTTDLTQQVMVDIASHPEVVPILTEEVQRVLTAKGWTQSALSELKLLDSTIKESQRLKPIDIASMRRKVTQDITLSTGLVLKKGTRLHVDLHRMRSPLYYADPEQWKPFRFAEMRDKGDKSSAQLVSTSMDHMGFGHGLHACPGRFFASAEVKVILCHLLVNYEWELEPGSDVRPFEVGLVSTANLKTRLLMRRRERPVFDLDTVGDGKLH